MKKEDESTIPGEHNPGGCLGMIVGLGLGLIIVSFCFPWMEGQPRKMIAILVTCPPIISLLFGWALGFYVWKLCFPNIGKKANKQLIGCFGLALFFAFFVGGLLLMLFGADVLESIQGWQ